MEFSHIEIKSTPDNHGEPSAFAELFIDGHKVRGVRRLEYVLEPNGVPALKIDLNALDIAIDQKTLVYQYGMGKIKEIIWDDEDELPKGSPPH